MICDIRWLRSHVCRHTPAFREALAVGDPNPHTAGPSPRRRSAGKERFDYLRGPRLGLGGFDAIVFLKRQRPVGLLGAVFDSQSNSRALLVARLQTQGHAGRKARAGAMSFQLLDDGVKIAHALCQMACRL